jgi:hypothetical protein
VTCFAAMSYESILAARLTVPVSTALQPLQEKFVMEYLR